LNKTRVFFGFLDSPRRFFLPWFLAVVKEQGQRTLGLLAKNNGKNKRKGNNLQHDSIVL
jgi:hypothetical protein